jgi:hypothetical protein
LPWLRHFSLVYVAARESYTTTSVLIVVLFLLVVTIMIVFDTIYVS